MYQDEETIYRLLQEEFSLDIPGSSSLHFYGSGCINNHVNALNRYFIDSITTVDTDLMGAARSLCQHHEGIACILGTGSNSCYYDGHEITRNVSPLGYMLGDEGSGAVIGRKFIADLLKNQLPESVRTKFFETFDFTPQQIMDQVYRKPLPNRYLAQFMKFIQVNLEEPSLRNLVKDSFMEFFARNIRQYPEAQHLPVHFTGSVAYYFKPLLSEAAKESGFNMGNVTEAPMEGLVHYHLHQ
jgi:N-acetylglucosamine kinase-like BadF-type ATPase